MTQGQLALFDSKEDVKEDVALNVGDVVRLARIKENDIEEELYYQDVMGMKGTVIETIPDAIGVYYNVQFNKVQRCVRAWHVVLL